MDRNELRALVSNDLVARGAIPGRAEVFADRFAGFVAAQTLAGRNDGLGIGFFAVRAARSQAFLALRTSANASSGVSPKAEQ